MDSIEDPFLILNAHSDNSLEELEVHSGVTHFKNQPCPFPVSTQMLQ